jgi:hypothetical protein
LLSKVSERCIRAHDGELKLAREWWDKVDVGEVSAVDECRCSINITNMLLCYHRLLEEKFLEDRAAFPLDRIDLHWHLFDATKLEAEAAGKSAHASVDRVAPPDYPEPSAVV